MTLKLASREGDVYLTHSTDTPPATSYFRSTMNWKGDSASSARAISNAQVRFRDREHKRHMEEKKKPVHRMAPSDELAIIQKALGYVTFQPNEGGRYEHLDLGDPDINEVFGDRELGIRWGSIFEVHGAESSGKTTLCTNIAAIAQASSRHVYVGKADLEGSNDDRLNERLGIDMSRFYPFEAKLVVAVEELKKIDALRKKKEDGGKLTKLQEDKLASPPEPYEQTAEKVCDEMEAWIKFRRSRDPKAKVVLIIDSVTGLLVSEEEEGGLDEQNMRTKVSLASFMSLLLRRWVRLATNYKVIMLFINQERLAPGVMYGSPIVTSGGRALKFYASVRLRTRRSGNGRIEKDGSMIGLRSIVQNEKNKVGGKEHSEAAFKFYPRTGKFIWISKSQADKEAKKKYAKQSEA